jgi:hypothetical protein
MSANGPQGIGATRGPLPMPPAGGWPPATPAPPQLDSIVGTIRTGDLAQFPSAANLSAGLGSAELPALRSFQGQLQVLAGELSNAVDDARAAAERDKGSPAGREAQAGALVAQSRHDYVQALAARVEVEMTNRTAKRSGGDAVEPHGADRLVDFRHAQIGLADANQRYVQADMRHLGARAAAGGVADPMLEQQRSEAAAEVRFLAHGMQREGLVRAANDNQATLVSRWPENSHPLDEMWSQARFGVQELAILEMAYGMTDCYHLDEEHRSSEVGRFEGDFAAALEQNRTRDLLLGAAGEISALNAECYGLVPMIEQNAAMTALQGQIAPEFFTRESAAAANRSARDFTAAATLCRALIVDGAPPLTRGAPLPLYLVTQVNIAQPPTPQIVGPGGALVPAQPQGPLRTDVQNREQDGKLVGEAPADVRQAVADACVRVRQGDSALRDIRPHLEMAREWLNQPGGDMMFNGMRAALTTMADKLLAEPDRRAPPEPGTFMDFADRIRGYSALMQSSTPEMLVTHAMAEDAPRDYFVEPKPLTPTPPQAPPYAT